MSTKHKLPRFPPRKARASPRLIKFLMAKFTSFSPFPVKIPRQSSYTPFSFWELLILAGVSRTSISRKAREMRERKKTIPSGETTLRWLRALSMAQTIQHQEKKLMTFLDALPTPFQRVRRKGMILTLDFHLDPNYAKQKSEYIVKATHKAGTNRFFCYLTLLWTNAPEPVTLGVIPIPQPRSNFQVTQRLLNPWIKRERIKMILADGEFDNWDLINYLEENNIFYVIRGHMGAGMKKIAQNNAAKLTHSGQGLILPYTMKKGNVKWPHRVKLVLWVEHNQVISFVIPVKANWNARQIRELYRRRFAIETYYRMAHRFQVFSCSQQPVFRFILVSLAFWMCNFWCYFKSPLKSLKATSKHVGADKVYPATLFCESIYESWLFLLHLTPKKTFGRG